MTSTNHDLSIERVIDAAPEAVFDGFIDMYGPDRPDWILDSRLDLRVGGSWRVDFHPPGVEPFTEMRVIGELDRPRRLAYETTVLSASGARRFSTSVAFGFEADGDRTRLRLEQQGFPTVGDRDDFAQAWPSVLTLLAQRIGG